MCLLRYQCVPTILIALSLRAHAYSRFKKIPENNYVHTLEHNARQLVGTLKTVLKIHPHITIFLYV